MIRHNPIICAIDTPDLSQAKALVQAVKHHVGMVKLGLEFFSIHGPQGVAEVTENGALPFFLDLKFHDIPNTVAGAVRAVLPLNPKLLTIHCTGSTAMMQAAKAAAAESSHPPSILGVTVLTSLDDADMQATGVQHSAAQQVETLATLAAQNGLDGIVCSPHEAQALRTKLGENFLLVTPGVRPANAAQGDQKRVMTPREALSAGADYLVIGRPITAADAPSQAAKDILTSIS
jgi:orotidine-5'-phosphate decarboxylase